MKETQPHSHSKVSLEELLRLKRAERPSQEFWVQFESDLRRKQLAAIVEKRAWWQVLPIVLTRRTWVSLPLGAAAAVALTFVATHRTAPAVSPAHLPVAEAPSQATVAPTVAAATEAPALPVPSSVVATVDSAPREEAPAAVPAQSEVVQVAAAESPEPVSRLTAFLSELRDTHLSADQSVYAALELAPAYRAPGQASEGVSAQTISEQSSQLDQEVQDPRRARLMAYAEPALANPSAPTSRTVRTRERVASRLSERSLYDSISRLDMNGESLSIKF